MTEFITEREFNLALDPIREDVTEIKGDVKMLLASKYDNSFLGGRGHALFVVALPVFLSILASVLIAIYLT